MVHFEDKVNYLCQINNRCGIIWRIRENGVFHRQNKFSTLSLGKGIFFNHTLGRISFRIFIGRVRNTSRSLWLALLPNELSNNKRNIVWTIHYS